MEAPQLLSIQQLLDKIKTEKIEFYIPGYQRGYRWNSEQANRLINDIKQYKFHVGSCDSPPPYLLQPIVVCKKDMQSAYDVIDGQQRLTTIYLLLCALGHEGFEIPLHYDSFPDWQEKFVELKDKDIKETYFAKLDLNHHHIAEVYDICKNNLKNSNPDFKSCLLNNVKIIWSDISEESRRPEANMDHFNKLNDGKIPLTAGELLKGLFLQENLYNSAGVEQNPNINNPEERILAAVRDLVKNSQRAHFMLEKISREWDNYERILHDEPFWHFIYGEEVGFIFETRIEYLFNLVLCVKKGEESLASFHKIADELEKKDSSDAKIEYLEKVWNELGRYLSILQEWYRDKTYYHLLGFLIAVQPWLPIYEQDGDGFSVKETQHAISYFIQGIFQDAHWSKRTLEEKIREQISYVLGRNKKEEERFEIADLRYDTNPKQIRRVLLFFNIISIMSQNGSERFPFDRFKEEKWDIEHIASQTDFEVGSRKRAENITWAAYMLQYLTGLKVLDFCDEALWSVKGFQYVENDYGGPVKRVLKLKENEGWKKPVETAIDSFKKESSSGIEKTCHDEKVKICESIVEAFSGKEDFSNAFDKVKDLFAPKDSAVNDEHILGNLTLLNMHINRGYGNAIFPIKRMTILEESERGFYIPPCTQKVFQKSYSRRFDQLYCWTENDAMSYQDEIIQSIVNYLNK